MNLKTQLKDWVFCAVYRTSKLLGYIPGSEFPNGAKAIVQQIPMSAERKKSERGRLWESQSGTWVGKLTI